MDFLMTTLQNFCKSSLLVRMCKFSWKPSLGNTWVFQYQCSEVSCVKAGFKSLAIKWRPSLLFYGDVLFSSGSLSLFGSRIYLLNWHISFFFFISPRTLRFDISFYHALTTLHVILLCLISAVTMWCLYSPGWIHHATLVLSLTVKRFLLFPLFQIINEMLSNNRSNIQSCITTFSKLSTHHWFPPLSKLSITTNIYGF